MMEAQVVHTTSPSNQPTTRPTRSARMPSSSRSTATIRGRTTVPSSVIANRTRSVLKSSGGERPLSSQNNALGGTRAGRGGVSRKGKFADTLRASVAEEEASASCSASMSQSRPRKMVKREGSPRGNSATSKNNLFPSSSAYTNKTQDLDEDPLLLSPRQPLQTLKFSPTKDINSSLLEGDSDSEDDLLLSPEKLPLKQLLPGNTMGSSTSPIARIACMKPLIQQQTTNMKKQPFVESSSPAAPLVNSVSTTPTVDPLPNPFNATPPEQSRTPTAAIPKSLFTQYLDNTLTKPPTAHSLKRGREETSSPAAPAAESDASDGDIIMDFRTTTPSGSPSHSPVRKVLRLSNVGEAVEEEEAAAMKLREEDEQQQRQTKQQKSTAPAAPRLSAGRSGIPVATSLSAAPLISLRDLSQPTFKKKSMSPLKKKLSMSPFKHIGGSPLKKSLPLSATTTRPSGPTVPRPFVFGGGRLSTGNEKVAAVEELAEKEKPRAPSSLSTQSPSKAPGPTIPKPFVFGGRHSMATMVSPAKVVVDRAGSVSPAKKFSSLPSATASTSGSTSALTSAVPATLHPPAAIRPATRSRPAYPSSLGVASRPGGRPPSPRITSIPAALHASASASASAGPSNRSVSAPLNSSTSSRQGLSSEASSALTGLAASLDKLKQRKRLSMPPSTSKSSLGTAGLSKQLQGNNIASDLSAPAAPAPSTYTTAGYPSISTAETSSRPSQIDQFNATALPAGSQRPIAGRKVSGGHSRSSSCYDGSNRPKQPSTSLLSASVSGTFSSTVPSLNVSLTSSKSTASISTLASIAPPAGKPAFLKGVVAFVDVRTNDGEEAGGTFISMLKSMGARVLIKPSENVTHFIFKGGKSSTMSFYRKLEGPKPHMLGIGWVIRCKESGSRSSEDDFKVDIESEGIFQKRRRTMEPKELAALANPTPLSSQLPVAGSSSTLAVSIENARRKSLLFAPKVSSPLKRSRHSRE